MNEWIAANIAVAGSVVIGSLLARIARCLLTRDRWPEALQRSAGALASLLFSVAVIIGLVTALGLVNKAPLDQLPEDLVDYVPRALSAAIVINITATFVAALERSLGHVSSGIRRRVPTVVQGSILFAGGLIAANQLGIDTTILTLGAAALFFGTALAMALMAAGGARAVASEIAAARALRRILTIGDRLDTDLVTGVIIDPYTVKVEVGTADDRAVLSPHSVLLDAVIGIERGERE